MALDRNETYHGELLKASLLGDKQGITPDLGAIDTGRGGADKIGMRAGCR